MRLFGFQIWPNLGLKRVDLGGRSGPERPQTTSRMVGREGPHHFGMGLRPFKAVEAQQTNDFRPRYRPVFKTKQSHF